MRHAMDELRRQAVPTWSRLSHSARDVDIKVALVPRLVGLGRAVVSHGPRGAKVAFIPSNPEGAKSPSERRAATASLQGDVRSMPIAPNRPHTVAR